MKGHLEIVVFSFDRAAQLDALLRSVRRYLHWENAALNVVYDCSAPDFERGYARLQETYVDVRFVREGAPERTPLRLRLGGRNIYRWLKYPWLRRTRSNFYAIVERVLARSEAEFAMFLTDDSVFLRDVNPTQDILSKLRTRPTQCSFKLSLGANIPGRPSDAATENGLLRWSYYAPDASGDWAYPFSVDGVVYHRATLNRILRRVFYANPNSLEGFVVEYVRRKRLFSIGWACERAALVGCALNRVQEVSPNQHLGIDPHALNDFFLKGYTLEFLHSDHHVFHADPADVLMVNASTGERVSVLPGAPAKQ